MQLFKTTIKPGVRLHCLQTDRFKTTSLSFYIHRPLVRQQVTMNALLPMVLRRGCPKFPVSRDLARQLDMLYGASVDTGVRKRGDHHVMIVTASFANEKFLTDSQPIFKPMLELMQNLLLEQTAFSEEYVQQEKENLKSQILAQLNDKRQYAAQRCLEEMFDGEPYGLDRLGYVDDLDAITAEGLYDYYRSECLKSPVDVFVCGDVECDEIKDMIASMFAQTTVQPLDLPPVSKAAARDEVKRVTQQEHIAQGKLSMGLRTHMEPNDERYPALMLYNAVLGHGPYSKLFNNVREKLSLAYYASSSLDYLKGIMIINSGIEVANFQKAYDEILEQMKQTAQGNISDQEFEAAVLGTVNQLKALADSAFQLEDFYLSRQMAGDECSPQQLVERILQVQKQQVVEVANNVTLDTVYFLKGVETDEV